MSVAPSRLCACDGMHANQHHAPLTTMLPVDIQLPDPVAILLSVPGHSVHLLLQVLDGRKFVLKVQQSVWSTQQCCGAHRYSPLAVFGRICITTPLQSAQPAPRVKNMLSETFWGMPLRIPRTCYMAPRVNQALRTLYVSHEATFLLTCTCVNRGVAKASLMM